MTSATEKTPTGRLPRSEPPMHRIVHGDNYLTQALRAAATQSRMHERMLALGAKWDGIDGYCFSGDYSASELRILLNEFRDGKI